MRLFATAVAISVAQGALVLFVAAKTDEPLAYVVGGVLLGIAIGMSLTAIFSRGFTRTRRGVKD